MSFIIINVPIYFFFFLDIWRVVVRLRISTTTTGLEFQRQENLLKKYVPVSYTHLDVYKRQPYLYPCKSYSEIVTGLKTHIFCVFWPPTHFFLAALSSLLDFAKQSRRLVHLRVTSLPVKIQKY